MRSTTTRAQNVRVHRRLVLEHADGPGTRPRPRSGERLATLVRERAPGLIAGGAPSSALVDELVDEVAGLGPLEPWLADPDVTEVMLNGPGRAFVERRGVLEAVELGLDAPAIVQLVERVVAPRSGCVSDRASPMVDAPSPRRLATARG